MTDRSTAIRAKIKEFLEERLQKKLKSNPETWIADAVQRVDQIQQVTHAVKYTHPDARATNLNKHGNPMAGDLLIGTHSLGHGATLDVAGHAGALDVYNPSCHLSGDEDRIRNMIFQAAN